jgi:putative toxin-antitoxin system antitoxin component (TIGR02293 family)
MTTIERLLETFEDPFKEMHLIRTGMGADLVKAFLDREKMPVKDTLLKLDIPVSTFFSKKGREVLDSYSTEKFVRLFSTLLLASKILGKDQAKTWLYEKIPSLGNEVPISLLDTETGHRLVVQALLQIKYGVYG